MRGLDPAQPSTRSGRWAYIIGQSPPPVNCLLTTLSAQGPPRPCPPAPWPQDQSGGRITAAPLKKLASLEDYLENKRERNIAIKFRERWIQSRREMWSCILRPSFRQLYDDRSLLIFLVDYVRFIYLFKVKILYLLPNKYHLKCVWVVFFILKHQIFSEETDTQEGMKKTFHYNDQDGVVSKDRLRAAVNVKDSG